MASRRIGSEEVLLLVIETDEFTASIKGRPTHPVAEGLGVIPDEDGQLYCASLDIAGDYIGARCYDPQADAGLQEYFPGMLQYACFYEQTGYQLVIESKGDRELSFYHSNPQLRSAVSPVGMTGRVLSGVLNFRNEVGLSTFEMRTNGTTLLQVTLEVFPSKLNYKDDYFRLVQEVNAEVHNLAFDFLRRTYLKAKLNSRQQSSLTEFYSIISFIFDKLTVAFNRVKTSPHQRIITAHEVVRVEKVRRTDHASRKWLLRNAATLRPGEHGIQVSGMTYLPEKMLDARKRVSYDTYENRVLKWMLTRVIDRLGELKRRYASAQKEQSDTEVLKHLNRMTQSVRAMLGEDFLRETGRLTRLDGQSLVLQMAPGYREVYRYYLMLSKGLSIQGSIFQLSMKDVAQLYEYWCFLALGSILRKKYNLKRQDAIVIRGDGLAVTLDTTQRGNLHFTNPKSGEEYELSYNPVSYGLPTVAQRPDNILTLSKVGSDVQYQYVFDAKYRIDPAQEGTPYHKTYGTPGPQEDDINTMHRYRDALVYTVKGAYRRNTFGAVILFPYGDEARYAGEVDGKPHRFYRSIEQVGIGGLPFLPGHTRLVEDLLDKLILASPDTAHEQAGETIDTEQYYQERFEQRSVMVGVVRTPEHLAFHLHCRSYHIPLSQLPNGYADIQEVALYEPRRVSPDAPGIRFVAEVKHAMVASRHSITELPRRSDEQYVLFSLGPWTELPRKIAPAGYGVQSCIYTTPYLLKRASRLPELSLKSEDDIRLWKEVQRLGEEMDIKPTEKEMGPETKVRELIVGGITVKRVCEKLLLGGGAELAMSDVRVRPMHVLQIIKKLSAERGIIPLDEGSRQL